MTEAQTKKYFNYTRRFYRIFWHGETHALHYGFFDEQNQDLPAALENMNRKTVESVAIQSTDLVADFGFGVAYTKGNFYGGFSSSHLNQSKFRYTATQDSKLYRHYYFLLKILVT